MSYKQVILHLSLIEGIGPGLIAGLIQKLSRDQLKSLYQVTMSDVVQQFGWSEEKALILVQGLQDQLLCDRELELIDQYQASWITIACDGYPTWLAEISSPPVVLYFQGTNLFDQELMLAVVGARKAHSYSQEVITEVIVPLIQQDWVIVSGGAVGADRFAHQSAVDHGGKTIAVLGSGLCKKYPAYNKKLFDLMIEQGSMVVSAFPMMMDPHAINFPMRNRIIAGLSRGCLVLQAAAKSGALITAEFALQQGREVFAIPGPIHDPLSAGCNKLIQQGAKLVHNVQDVLDEFVISPVQQTIIQTAQQKSKPVIQQYGDAYDQQILQHTVVPLSVQELLSKVDVDFSTLSQKLFQLSLDGKVAQDSVGLWKRI